MAIFYSPTLNAFFDEAIHGERQRAVLPAAKDRDAGRSRPRLEPNPATRIPDDAIAITEEQHAELMAAQSAGQRIIARGKKPVVVDAASPDPEVQLAVVRSQRDQLLAETDKIVAVPDYPVTPEQKEEVLAYRKALRDVPASADPASPLATASFPERPVFLRGGTVEEQ